MKILNKKGFTLIELLAVIVILAILVAVAVPAVTKYLATARKGTFADNAQSAISAVRNDVIANNVVTDTVYVIGLDSNNKALTTVSDPTGITSSTTVNGLLDKKLLTSSYGKNYSNTSYVFVDFTDGIPAYYVCLADSSSNGISETEESEISEDSISTEATCTVPTAARTTP